MIRLTKGSDRNTQCCIVELHGHSFYFSYQTCVAYAGPASDKLVRRENHWGPTTARHMKDMGVSGWTIVPDDEFDTIVAKAVHVDA